MREGQVGGETTSPLCLAKNYCAIAINKNPACVENTGRIQLFY